MQHALADRILYYEKTYERAFQNLHSKDHQITLTGLMKSLTVISTIDPAVTPQGQKC